jgi:hypothetical protein
MNQPNTEEEEYLAATWVLDANEEKQRKIFAC